MLSQITNIMLRSVSQTMFAKLDKMKDKLGNYLIQPDVKKKKRNSVY